MSQLEGIRNAFEAQPLSSENIAESDGIQELIQSLETTPPLLSYFYSTGPSLFVDWKYMVQMVGVAAILTATRFLNNLSYDSQQTALIDRYETP
jgi:hypothetical protein